MRPELRTGRQVPVARTAPSPPDLPTLDHAIGLVTELMGGCDHAVVTLVHAGGSPRLEAFATTSAVAGLAVTLQDTLGEGPDLEAVGTVLTSSADLRAEPRWTRWSRCW